ncbi:TIR domain-containing protein [Amycolatopsis acidicola]|uniref:TIR domain-containing protein n=1 Tax=Amycolatopsis acidicola TaxID=2596893 RepID=A0A5N0V6I3_9PSEU|nr:SEFIR domain-containing protein [Amycolatopsis acidicola]KAA9161625.1 TIR domain-containing protein [Amycolatopsis acidicola]
MRVFVSYTHDDDRHRQDVHEFAEFLVAQGIETDLDSWTGTSRQDWHVWATKHMSDADFVLVVASTGYRAMGDGLGPAGQNRGGQSEAAFLRDRLQVTGPRGPRGSCRRAAWSQRG